MSVGDWLRARTPAPPDRLLQRLDHVLAARRDDDASRASDHLLDAADELLRDLLHRPTAGRESALDLLTVDALVTYAFEAAGDDPDTVGERAAHAMHRLAAAARE
jgi:hypothetical protein